ncbi:MAG TPA: thermonuclease family protein [Desulfosarcina sp.]|nr:thermonuclease family protein [Desulfosarcina sp.]
MIVDKIQIANPKYKAGGWLLLFMWLAAAEAFGFAGTVADVDSGDTLVVVMSGERRAVRLYGIDAPASGQQGANAAKRYLRSIALGSPVEVEVAATDVFDRPVAVVRRPSIPSSVNAAVVANGYAWVNPKSCVADICGQWRELQEQAKKYRLGIWSGYDLTPPWEFRSQQRR